MVLTLANSAANHNFVSAAIVIIPFVDVSVILQTVLLQSHSIVWFSLVPECEVPGGSISPRPGALLFDVITAEPSLVYTSCCQFTHHVVVCGHGVDCGQVGAIALAKVLSISPICLEVGEVVTVVPILVPARIASAGHRWK